MSVAGDGDTAAVEIPRFIEFAQLFERLAAMEISGGVIRIGLGNGFKGGDGATEVARFDVFHRQSIAREGARGILLKELFEDFDSGGFQTVRIPYGRGALCTFNMACPFFRPSRLMERGSGRAPLGGMFEGQCERHGIGGTQLCNFGYARGLCADFPGDSDADAVRFSVTGSTDGVVTLIWIFEKDHAPMRHGVLKYCESSREFVDTPDGVLRAQARVFLENYLRQ